MFPCHIISLSPSCHTGTKDQPPSPPPKAPAKPGRTRKQNNYVRGSSDRFEGASADVTQLSGNLISRATGNWVAL